jgi:hypothetical protein
MDCVARQRIDKKGWREMKSGLRFFGKAVTVERLIVIIFLVLSLRVLLWFEYPRILVCGDLRPPLNVEAFTMHAIYAWNEIDFGTPSVYLPRMLDPFNTLVTISSWLGFDLYSAQMLTLIIMYFLMSLLVYAYVRELADGDKILAFVSALFFNFNVFLVNDREQTAVGFVSIVLMLLPSLAAFARALRKRSRGYAALSGMLLVLTQGTFPNYRPLLLGVFAVMLTTLYFLISRGSKIQLSKIKGTVWKFDVSVDTSSIVGGLKSVLVFCFSAILASLWILVIVATNWNTLFSVYQRISPSSFVFDVQSYDVFRLIAQWSFYAESTGHPYVPYADIYLHNPTIILVTFLIPVLAFATLLVHSKHEKLKIYFAVIGLASIFLTTGFTKYLRGIYGSITTSIPLLSAFRTPTNWVFFVILSYSILLGILLSNLCKRFKGVLPKLFLLTLITLLFVSAAFPLITGDVTRNWLEPAAKGSAFPKSYDQLNDKLSYRYWALLLPKRSVYIIYNFSRGTLGCGNPYPFIFSKPIISGLGTEYMSPLKPDLTDQLHELVLIGNQTNIDITRRGNITASSVQGPGYSSQEAIDGSNTTRWSSLVGVPQWLEIEWEKPQELEDIEISFELAYAKAYSIQTWNGTDWINQISVQNNTSLNCYHTFPELVETDKVRLYFTEATHWGSISIWEITVRAHYESPSLSSRGLGIFGVGYLILEKSIAVGAAYNVTEAREKLNETHDFVLLEEWDDIALYQNLHSVEKLYVADTNLMYSGQSDTYNYLTDIPWDKLEHSILTTEATSDSLANVSAMLPEDFTWKEISPCKYKANVMSKGPFFVAFLENFDTQWKLAVNEKTVPESNHFVINTFGNGWLVDASGNLTLELTFETQKFMVPSIIASLILPLLLITGTQIRKIVVLAKHFKLRRTKQISGTEGTEIRGG